MKNSPHRALSAPAISARAAVAVSLPLLLRASLSLPPSHSAGGGPVAVLKSPDPGHSGPLLSPAAAADEDDYSPHLLAATYYSLKGGLRATLILNN